MDSKMATGGRMTRSVIGSSDVIYDFSCTPCTEDGKNTEAVTYCVDCKTYFCQTCVGHHNKVFKSHKPLDKTAMRNTGQQPKQKKGAVHLPSKDCDEHPGNAIQMYCGSHDVVCCTVCIAVEHRSCNGVDFIPKLAKGILDSTVKQDVETALDKIRREVEQRKSEKTKELFDLKKKKADILDDITKLKLRLITRINEMERKSTEEVSARFQEVIDTVNNDIDSLNDMLKSVETQVNGIADTQSNESVVYVAIKDGQKFESSCKTLLQQLKDASIETLSFEYNTEVKFLLDKVENFGTIQTTDDVNDPYTATLEGEYDVKVSGDNSSCIIYDVCLFDENQFIISDYANDKIKTLDQTFCVTDSCKMPRPWGVCKTRTDEIAVTLFSSEKVQFVKLGSKLACTRSFSTEISCRGIKYNNDTLVIACGAYSQSGEVRLYSLSGSLLGSYKNDMTGGVIMHLMLSSDGSQIYICDVKKGIVILDSQGNKLSVVTHQNLKYTFGVSIGNQNEIFVCGHLSNNIFQLDRRGANLQEILTRSDGIRSPLSVTFVTNPKRLIVTGFKSDKIKVFKLS